MKTRKFNGTVFTLQFVRTKKSDAQALRKHVGGCTRIVETKEGYAVYAKYPALRSMRKRSKTK